LESTQAEHTEILVVTQGACDMIGRSKQLVGDGAIGDSDGILYVKGENELFRSGQTNKMLTV
jgi:hypothetical protein